MNLNYVKAAEQDIRSLPYLKKSIATLEKRRSFILAKGVKDEDPNLSDPYITEKKINEDLNEKLALAEISAEIISVKSEIEMIEETLKELPDEERKVLIMFFQQGLAANKIAEKIYRESEKTVYKIRNQGIYHYCLIYYGKKSYI